MTATEETLDYVVARLYEENSHKTRASYACDLLDIVAQSARYDDIEPVLTPETFDKAHRLFIPEQA